MFPLTDSFLCNWVFLTSCQISHNKPLAQTSSHIPFLIRPHLHSRSFYKPAILQPKCYAPTELVHTTCWKAEVPIAYGGNRASVQTSLWKAFIVLHSLVHMKSGRNICVKNEKIEKFKRWHLWLLEYLNICLLWWSERCRGGAFWSYSPHTRFTQRSARFSVQLFSSHNCFCQFPCDHRSATPWTPLLRDCVKICAVVHICTIHRISPCSRAAFQNSC